MCVWKIQHDGVCWEASNIFVSIHIPSAVFFTHTLYKLGVFAIFLKQYIVLLLVTMSCFEYRICLVIRPSISCYNVYEWSGRINLASFHAIQCHVRDQSYYPCGVGCKFRWTGHHYRNMSMCSSSNNVVLVIQMPHTCDQLCCLSRVVFVTFLNKSIAQVNIMHKYFVWFVQYSFCSCPSMQPNKKPHSGVLVWINKLGFKVNSNKSSFLFDWILTPLWLMLSSLFQCCWDLRYSNHTFGAAHGLMIYKKKSTGFITTRIW